MLLVMKCHLLKHKLGAEMEFGAKYPDIVSLYFIEDKDGNPIIKKEFCCGGPSYKKIHQNLAHLKSKRRSSGSWH